MPLVTPESSLSLCADHACSLMIGASTHTSFAVSSLVRDPGLGVGQAVEGGGHV